MLLKAACGKLENHFYSKRYALKSSTFIANRESFSDLVTKRNSKDLENLLTELKKRGEYRKPATIKKKSNVLEESKHEWRLNMNKLKPSPDVDFTNKLKSLLDRIHPKTNSKNILVRDGILTLIESKFIEKNIIFDNITLNRKMLGLNGPNVDVCANDVSNLDLLIFQDFLTTLKESKSIENNNVKDKELLNDYLNRDPLVQDKSFYKCLTENLYNVFIEATKDDFSNFKRITKLYMNSLYETHRASKMERHTNDEKILKILTNPIHWYPETRLYKRKIVLHIGPTNSGKTFNAIERLKTATGRSFYAGPLRLLAKEIYDRFNHNFKIPCNLTTGESIIEKIDPSTGRVSNISSGTTELLAKQIQAGMEYDVVVLDEIQNIGLKQRGFAWCDILLGCKAKELHLCGEPRVVNIIKKICEITKDELIIKNYTRLSTLTMEPKAIEDWSELKSGDCIIESSRKRIIDLKFRIEKETNHSVSVVYGGLPLEARLQQSYMFNSRASTILVASNAVGVGLNLNINRIIFNDIKRTDGENMVLFDSSEIRQIAGRAGRYNRNGNVTCIKHKDNKTDSLNTFTHVQRVLEEENPPIETIYVFPPMNIISKMYDIFNEKYQYQMGFKFQNKYERYLKFFDFLSKDLVTNQQSTEPVFKFAVDEVINKKQLPKLQILGNLNNLTFYDLLMLMNSPIKFQFRTESEFFSRCVQGINDNKTMTIFSLGLPLNVLKIFVNYPIADANLYKEVINSSNGNKILANLVKLESLEQLYRCLVLFSWLQNRYPNNFLDASTVMKLQQRCELIIFYKLSVEPVYDLSTRIEIKNRIIKRQQQREKIKAMNSRNTNY